MKIKIKITAAEILYLDSKAQEINNVDFIKVDRKNKASCSILFDVADKIEKAIKSLNHDFTNGKKPHSVSFKWHELEVLELFLSKFEETDPFCANMSRKILSQINQKLA